MTYLKWDVDPFIINEDEPEREESSKEQVNGESDVGVSWLSEWLAHTEGDTGDQELETRYLEEDSVDITHNGLCLVLDFRSCVPGVLAGVEEQTQLECKLDQGRSNNGNDSRVFQKLILRQVFVEFRIWFSQSHEVAQGKCNKEILPQELEVTQVRATVIKQYDIAILNHSVESDELEDLERCHQGRAAFLQQFDDAGDVLDLGSERGSDRGI